MSDQLVKWRLPEQWTIMRADGGRVIVDLTQDGDAFAGTACASAPDPDVAGIVSGSTTGDSIEMTLYWPGGSVDQYRGTIGLDGMASGTATDQAGSSDPAPWHAEAGATRWS